MLCLFNVVGPMLRQSIQLTLTFAWMACSFACTAHGAHSDGTLTPMAKLQLPMGNWVRTALSTDDSEYNSMSFEWLRISNGTLELAYSIGAHVASQEFQIVAQNENSFVVYYETRQEKIRTYYQLRGSELELCPEDEAPCQVYSSTTHWPQFTLPPDSHPSVQLTIKWCVESDCEVQDDLSADAFFNLYDDFTTPMGFFPSPGRLRDEHELTLYPLVYSYRLGSDGSRMDSFSVAVRFYVYDTSNPVSEVARSGVLVLQDGMNVELSGKYQGKIVSTTLNLRQTAGVPVTKGPLLQKRPNELRLTCSH